MIRLKQGVFLIVSPENDRIIRSIDEALHVFNLHATVTSGFDGVHKRISKHLRNEAVDFRISDWPAALRNAILQEISRSGSDLRYMLEVDHLHVETLP